MFALNSCKTRLLLLPQITTTTTTTKSSHLRLLHHHHQHHYVQLHFSSSLKAHFKSTTLSSSPLSPPPPPAADSSSSSSSSSLTAATVDFLVDSCGLSYEEALQVIREIPSLLQDDDGGRKPRSVIAYFESIGFSKTTHISKAISKCPRLLVSDVEKTFKPKIQLLQDYGFSESDIADLISSRPTILRRSLKNQMKPNLDLIKSFVKTDEDLIKIVKRFGILGRTSYRRNFIEANIHVLQHHGVPDSEILHLILTSLNTLMSTPKVFKLIVQRIVSLGFKPEIRMFVIAVVAMSGMRKATWDSKIDLLKGGLGWSDEQILDAFRRNPMYLRLSVENLKESIGFFKERMNWDASILSHSSLILNLSLKKRVIPRYAVLKCLMSKEIIKQEKQFISMLLLTETNFLTKYVFKYQEQLPYLYSEVYEKGFMLGCEEDNNGEITNQQQDHDDIDINLG